MAKTCSYTGCSNPRWKNNPEDSKEGWCKYHIPTDLKKAKPNGYITKSNLKTKRKPTGEMALFRAIWGVRPHVSFVSSKPVEFAPITFAHALNKNKWSKFRYYDKNIVLLTPEEHYALDFGTEEDRKKLGGNWEKLYELREQLKQEYNNFYGRDILLY